MPTACCPVCALPTPGAEICGACLKRAPHFDATHVLWQYAFPVDKLIQSLKYGHRLASADFLGQALAHHIAEKNQLLRPDLILPVPLSAPRLAQRGFNQAVEIARLLASAWELSIECNLVQRHRDTTPQAGLPWKERAKNVRDAFKCSANLGNISVLVVDDVMTTGSTLDELARVLKANGAGRVENCVLARALKD